MQTDKHMGVEPILTEITTYYGYVPPIFTPAAGTPATLANLWQQTKDFYTENPLPVLFKDELLAYLSRYCRSSYCMICHSCMLHAQDVTGGEIFALLTSRAPTPLNIELRWQNCSSVPIYKLPAWPVSSTNC